MDFTRKGNYPGPSSAPSESFGPGASSARRNRLLSDRLSRTKACAAEPPVECAIHGTFHPLAGATLPPRGEGNQRFSLSFREAGRRAPSTWGGLSHETFPLARNSQLGARTETEKAGLFTNKKVQAVAGTTDKLFCEEKRPEFSVESRDPTGNFGLARSAEPLKRG
jgi:hypothetical protein